MCALCLGGSDAPKHLQVSEGTNANLVLHSIAIVELDGAQLKTVRVTTMFCASIEMFYCNNTTNS